MLIRIQRGSSTPISRQIDAQIRAQILSGILVAEEQLPSVRQLARELAVNVNTVVRVYERLAADGLVELRHGDGTYVTYRRKQATAGQLAERQQEFQQELEAIARRGLMLGATAEELPRMLEAAIARVRRDDSESKSPTVSKKVPS